MSSHFLGSRASVCVAIASEDQGLPNKYHPLLLSPQLLVLNMTSKGMGYLFGQFRSDAPSMSPFNFLLTSSLTKKPQVLMFLLFLSPPSPRWGRVTEQLCGAYPPAGVNPPYRSVILSTNLCWCIVHITRLSSFKALYYATLPTPKRKKTYHKCLSGNANCLCQLLTLT